MKGAAKDESGRRGGVSLDAQRRRLTVMFCDLVGSTELSTRLDEEEMHELIGAFLKVCADSIEEAGGFVARYMGDGVLAYFGYPQAHEDDPERAIQAALAINERAAAIPTRHGQPLVARAGIATGMVVVGDLIGEGAAQERSVVGETPNLAARLQGTAAPGSVVVSNATREGAAATFDFRDLGPVSLKGLVLREPVWEVTGARAAARRFGSGRTADPGRLVGRDAELETVLGHWAARADGGGRIVGLVGEPGIGKSRLLHEAQRRIALQPHVWLEGGGAQVFRNTPFYAVSQMIRRRLMRGGTASLARLEQTLAAAGVTDPQALALVADLIGVATPTGYAPLALGPEQRRERLIATLADWLLETARRFPTVMTVEDLHWADPSTLELLDVLAARAAEAPFLLLYTARDEMAPPWPDHPRHHRIDLPRLGAEAVRQLVSGVGGEALTDEAAAAVAERAGGVPLFAEELARLIVERKGEGDAREIPATLSDLLTARLDQLGPFKDVAQIASILGGEFQLGLLGAVCGLTGAELDAALSALNASEVIVRREGREEATCAFRHALIRDAAYGALLKTQRRTLHRRAARTIEAQFPGLAERQPEVLAQHWTGAEEWDRAVGAWQAAGRTAGARRAFAEAGTAYQQAIATLGELPATVLRDDRELELQSALAGVLQITRGYSAPEAMAATDRARALAEQGGDLEKQFAHLAGMWMAASSGGDYETAGRVAEQLQPLAGALGALDDLGAARMILMTSRYRVGDFIGAEEAFTGGLEGFLSPGFRRRPGASPQTFGNGAVVAWLLGDNDEAHRRIETALAFSKEGGNPYEAAFGLYMAAMQAVMMWEYEKAETLAAESVALSDELGFPQFAATSRVVLGRAQAELGRPQEGLASIRQGLEGMGGTRSRAGVSMYTTWLAETLALAGDLDGALATVEEALTANPQERFWRPESLRLRAEFRLAAGDLDGARNDALQAVALAKDMDARTFHARALETRAKMEA